MCSIVIQVVDHIDIKHIYLFTIQADKGRRGTVSNGQSSINPGIAQKTIPEEKGGAVGGTNRDTDDDEDDDDDE